MDEDNLYPNDSFFWAKEPKDQAIGRKRERALTLEALPILKEAIAHLDTQIDFYGKVMSIPDNVRAEPDKFLIILNAHTIVVQILMAEKEFLQGLLDAHAPPS